jgi:hypothetical protein
MGARGVSASHQHPALEPLPGMLKKRSVQCRYWFAVPVAEAEPPLGLTGRRESHLPTVRTSPQR